MGNVVRRPNKKSIPRPGLPARPTKYPLENNGAARKYGYIPDQFSSIEEVALALREEGLESSNLIVGFDFTKSNEWTGRNAFNFRCLHTISDKPNPYEQAIGIIGRTLAPFDEDNLIPCFGFGDATTHDQGVFSFHNDHSPCHGFEEVLACYRKIAPQLQLSGPTSFAPIVDVAVDIVERSHGQFHVLLILADGQITRSSEPNSGVLSKQHEKTIESIVTASSHPLAIIVVGVGDGPWEGMQEFDDELPARVFDNFQFVNFTKIMSTKDSEPAFALAALMEIPFQYKACLELGLLGRQTGRVKRVVPRPPPIHSRYHQLPSSNDLPKSPAYIRGEVCPLCFANEKDLALGCGHLTCRECGMYLSICPICHTTIISRFRVYSG